MFYPCKKGNFYLNELIRVNCMRMKMIVVGKLADVYVDNFHVAVRTALNCIM